MLAGLTPPPEAVANIVTGRCAMCHAPEPSWPGIQIAPKGVLLHEPAPIAAHARAIRVAGGDDPCDAAQQPVGHDVGGAAGAGGLARGRLR